MEMVDIEPSLEIENRKITVERAHSISSCVAIPGKVAESQYEYLASKQQSKHAVLPVHTQQERTLFHRLLRRGTNENGTADWVRMCKQWSRDADGVGVFYKTPAYLQAYHRKWIESRVFTNAVNSNRQIVDPVRQLNQDTSRSQNALPAQVPARLRINNPEAFEIGKCFQQSTVFDCGYPI